MSTPLDRLLARLGAWDRRLAGLRERAALALLRRERPGLVLGPRVKLEPGLLWRLHPTALVRIGAGSRLRRSCELKADAYASLSLGVNVHLGPGCTISVLEHVAIGDDCLIAERVSIRDHDHAARDASLPYHAQGYVTAPVTIGRNVWIGAGVTIVKGVTLGDGCIVGANAVVTRSFPTGSVVAGVPARLVRQLGGPVAAEPPARPGPPPPPGPPGDGPPGDGPRADAA